MGKPRLKNITLSKGLSPDLPGPQIILLVHLWGCFKEKKGDPEQVAGARPDSDVLETERHHALPRSLTSLFSASLVSQNLHGLPF